MNIFNKEELLIAAAFGLVMVAVATVAVPLVTGSLTAFTLVRFIYGVLMNIATIQIVLLQMRMPESRRNQAVAGKQVFYSVVSIMVALLCGGFTRNWDWRLEALLWYAVPPLLGLYVAFPDWWQRLKSLPSVAQTRMQKIEMQDVVYMTPSMLRGLRLCIFWLELFG